MGASSWSYITEYTSEPQQALETLHGQVLESGKYGFGHNGNYEPPVGSSDYSKVPLKIRLLIAAIIVVFRPFAFLYRMGTWASTGFRWPRNAEAARNIYGASGTHSILDIERCDTTSGLGVASPIHEPRLRLLFGTSTPTREDIDRNFDKISDRQDRGTATYIIVYDENASPASILFVGVTGD